MINNNLTTEKAIAYFRDYIYTKGLEEIKPGVGEYPMRLGSMKLHQYRVKP